MQAKESILTKTYDFVKSIIPLINAMPRDQRYILGSRLEEMSLALLELLIEAYYLPKSEKESRLRQANLQLEKLRYLIRLCFELKYYNAARFEMLTTQLLEIGRMIGGWVKSLDNESKKF